MDRMMIAAESGIRKLGWWREIFCGRLGGGGDHSPLRVEEYFLIAAVHQGGSVLGSTVE